MTMAQCTNASVEAARKTTMNRKQPKHELKHRLFLKNDFIPIRATMPRILEKGSSATLCTGIQRNASPYRYRNTPRPSIGLRSLTPFQKGF